MAKMQKYELDAVVSTVLERIRKSNEGSDEQKEYERLTKLQEKLETQANEELEQFRKQLIEKYSKLSEGLNVEENYRNRISIDDPTPPKYNVNERTIEREIIVANISGNVEETIESIVKKYTK